MKKLIMLVMVVVPFSSFAAMKGSGKMPLAVAGGVSTPSFSTSVFQNPAGMRAISKLNLNLQGGWDSSFGNSVYRGDVLYGNETFGLGGGIAWMPTPSAVSGFFGLGVGVDAIKTSFGVSSFFGLSPSSSASFNAGILISPVDKLRLGFTALGLSGGISEWGAGLAFTVVQAVTLVFDATANSGLDVLNFKPGISVGDQRLGITGSYGFGNGGSTQLSSGFTAGAYFDITDRIHWEAYYNMLSTYFTSLSFAF